MVDIVNLDGEVIDTDLPPLTETEWHLLLRHARFWAFHNSITNPKNPQIVKASDDVLRIVARYTGEER